MSTRTEHAHCWHKLRPEDPSIAYCCGCTALPSPASSAPQPTPDADEGEWRVVLSAVQGYYITDTDGNEIIRDAHAPKSVFEQIVRDHSAVPHLEAALRQAHNAAQAFIDSKNLSTAQAGLRSIVRDIRTALASAQEKQ